MKRATIREYTVEFEREADGRWIADVLALPGCIAYGVTRERALAAVRRLACEVLEGMVAAGESPPADPPVARLRLEVPSCGVLQS
ncbi:MAG: type II toxin-antitoxin system HicB family antitoxin [Deltaproteobacteria bacterium]|nr:type II toxin-antitoxin system HicB family antitoxin [Deltaproteobacteria bacterium]